MASHLFSGDCHKGRPRPGGPGHRHLSGGRDAGQRRPWRARRCLPPTAPGNPVRAGAGWLPPLHSGETDPTLSESKSMGRSLLLYNPPSIFIAKSEQKSNQDQNHSVVTTTAKRAGQTRLWFRCSKPQRLNQARVKTNASSSGSPSAGRDAFQACTSEQRWRRRTT
jgi:hypothetical protein